MIFKKISNTLLKGLLLLVLALSPAASVDPKHLLVKNDQVISSNKLVGLQNKISVSASEKKPKNKLHKNQFASYLCNEDSYKPLLAKINNLREENNISIATLDGQLNAVACAHTKWMLKNQKFGHRGQDGSGFKSRCLEADTKCEDESILNNIENDFVSMFTKAINDTNTKEKMLNPDNKNIGFAYEQGVLTVIYR